MKKTLAIFAVFLLAMTAASLADSSCEGRNGIFKWMCYAKEKFGVDYDMVDSSVDNCPLNFNPSQRDTDNDSIGNACDGIGTADEDGDGVTIGDNCYLTYNPSQRDTDNDSIGDACDFNHKDFDWDGVKNGQDNCMWHYNPSQTDSDNKGYGDICDVCDANAFTRLMYKWTGTCPLI